MSPTSCTSKLMSLALQARAEVLEGDVEGAGEDATLA